MKFSFAILFQLERHFRYSRIGVKIAPRGGYKDMGEMDAEGKPSVELAKAIYGSFCTELNRLGLAYVQVMRWWAAYDPMLGGKQRVVNWDPIVYLRPILSHTILVGNTGFTPEEANEWIRDSKVDAVVIDRPLLYNPDYVELVAGVRRDEMHNQQPRDEFH